MRKAQVTCSAISACSSKSLPAHTWIWGATMFGITHSWHGTAHPTSEFVPVVFTLSDVGVSHDTKAVHVMCRHGDPSSYCVHELYAAVSGGCPTAVCLACWRAGAMGHCTGVYLLPLLCLCLCMCPSFKCSLHRHQLPALLGTLSTSEPCHHFCFSILVLALATSAGPTLARP